MDIRIGSYVEYLDIKDLLPEGKEFGCDSRSVEFLRGTLELKTEGVTTHNQMWAQAEWVI